MCVCVAAKNNQGIGSGREGMWGFLVVRCVVVCVCGGVCVTRKEGTNQESHLEGGGGRTVRNWTRQTQG